MPSKISLRRFISSNVIAECKGEFGSLCSMSSSCWSCPGRNPRFLKDAGAGVGC